jgi:hypothetical protein
MDIIIFFISAFASIIGFTIIISSALSRDWSIIKEGVCIFLPAAALLIWVWCASSYHKPTPKVTLHEIVNMRGVLFYFNEKDKPVEITGDARFADQKQTVIRITTVPSGWKYGIYVHESRNVELVNKPSVENTP